MKDLQEMKRVKLFLAGLCMVVMPCVSGAQEEEAVKGLHLVGRDLGKNVLLRWAAGDYALWMAALQKGFVLERYAFDTSSLYSASAYSDSMPPPVKTLIRIPPFMEMDTSVLASKAEEDPYAALLGEAVFSPGIQFSMGDDGSGNSPWKAISDKLQEKTIRFTPPRRAFFRRFAAIIPRSAFLYKGKLPPVKAAVQRVFGSLCGAMASAAFAIKPSIICAISSAEQGVSCSSQKVSIPIQPEATKAKAYS